MNNINYLMVNKVSRKTWNVDFTKPCIKFLGSKNKALYEIPRKKKF